jgi:hypothetical protein
MPAERITIVKRTVAKAADASPITSKVKVQKTKTASPTAVTTAVTINALDPTKKPVAVDEDIESKASLFAAFYLYKHIEELRTKRRRTHLFIVFTVRGFVAVHTYPKSQADRENAVNRHTGRKVTPFQFQVYDLCAQVILSAAVCYLTIINTYLIVSSQSTVTSCLYYYPQ